MIVANPALEEAAVAGDDIVPAPMTAGTTEQPLATVVTQISPPQGWQLINFRELWQFRELIYFLTWRDVKVRYKQTLLGAAWAILQPLLMMVVFTIFFGRMAGVSSGDVPYPLFAYAGLLPWTFFATAIAAAGNSVVGSERLITKIYFPRLAVPFAAVGAAVVDFVIAFGLLIAMMVYYRDCSRPWPAAGAGDLRADRAGGAGDRHAAGGAERRLPRFPLRHPVPGPALDVRDPDRLHAAEGRADRVGPASS